MNVEPNDEIRVAICLPLGDQVSTEFMLSVASLLNWTYANPPPGFTACGIIAFRGSVLPDSRNWLALKALEDGYTHILWIDSDMKFPHDALTQLIAHRVPVVGTNACGRRPPYPNTAETKPGVKLVTTKDSTGLEKVHRMGFAFALIETPVYRHKKMKPPFYTFEWVGNLKVHRGEDYFFCSQLRRCKIAIHVDNGLSRYIGHVGTSTFYPVTSEET